MSKQEEMAAELRTIREEIQQLRDAFGRPSSRAFAKDDAEKPDPRPHALFEDHASRPESIQEQIQRFVRNEMSVYAAKHEFGTFEEEDDFTEDDYEALPGSEFEVPDYELEADPDMPRIEDADDSRAMTDGDANSSAAEPLSEGGQPASSDGAAVAGAQAQATPNVGDTA